MFRNDTILKFLKGRDHAVTQASTNADGAIRLMKEQNVDVIGVKKFAKFFGIFTKSDYIDKVLNRDLKPCQTLLVEIVSAQPHVLRPTTSIEDAYDIMMREHVHHLPVLAERSDDFLGIVTEDDLKYELYQFYGTGKGEAGRVSA